MSDEPICLRCKMVHDRCGAHNKAGKPCQRHPIPGGAVCHKHGGNAPQVRKGAQERLERQHMAAALVSWGVDNRPAEEHPIDGLLLEVARSAQAVEFYGTCIADLEVPVTDDGLVDILPSDNPEDPDDEGVVLGQGKRYVWGRNHQGDLAPHVLVNLWNEERDRHARMCKDALRAGVDERRVQMAEQLGQAIVGVVMEVVNDEALQLTPAQQVLARECAARALRAIPAGSHVPE